MEVLSHDGYFDAIVGPASYEARGLPVCPLFRSYKKELTLLN